MINLEVFPGPRINRYHHLGGGIIRPFRRAAHGDLGSDQGVSKVLSNVGQVFGTQKKTLPWRPEFGSDLPSLLHKANTPVLREVAAQYASEALGLWEPRVKLTRMTVDQPRRADQNQVNIHASVAIDGAGDEHSLDVALRGALERTPPTELKVWDRIGSGRSPRGMPRVAAPAVKASQPSVTFSSGLLRPFRREGQGFVTAGGTRKILSNIGQVLGTKKGTFPWRPELGSDVEDLRHRANTPALQELARFYVEQALMLWEPRAQVTKVAVVDRRRTDDNELTVRALCRIPLFNDSAPFEVLIK